MTESPAATAVRPTGAEQRPTGWWGMVLTAMVIATTYAAMYFTAVYIRVSVERWPPEGVTPPALGLAALSAAALAGSAAAVWLSVRWMRDGGAAAMRVALAAGLLLGAGHVGLLAADWARVEFGPADHAYGSVFVILPAVHATLVVVALVMGAVVLALSLRAPDPLHHVAARSLGLYWYTVAVGGLVLLALIYLLPYVWGEPWPPTPPPP